ncbi:hypothetical protein [Prescottella agglutinans]|uniref:Uncharacterized protein n=1 Tax=Prescottella agglutinans TaxID=1644129 RepID=A0ABT6MEZ3_9NOCA|nr:hypothetical protein [Prescottella agglutinans]MDH6282866.1 hypothetical protein [Prescottella agglutinans]
MAMLWCALLNLVFAVLNGYLWVATGSPVSAIWLFISSFFTIWSLMQVAD